MDLEVSTPPFLAISTWEPRYSGRVVIQPYRFMYLRKSFKIILKEHETDPINYDESTSNIDAHLWQKSIKLKSKSMFSKNVWDFFNAVEEMKFIGCKWVYKRKKGIDRKVDAYRLDF